MKILIDADGCPVVRLTVDIAKEKEIECVVLSDTAHVFDIDGTKTVTVSKGADSVDFALVNMTGRGDIVVTQDYGLAAMALAKGARPISQNGMVYTESNIESLLSQQHLAKKIRRAGGRMKGPKKRTPQQDDQFRNALLRLIEDGRREENDDGTRANEGD